MPDDRTIQRAGVPKFSLHEIAYNRSSAIRGYLEPLIVIGFRWDPAISEFVYEFSREFRKTILGTVAPAEKFKLKPVELREAAVLNLCEAIDIQIDVLEKQLSDAQEQMTSLCAEPETQPATPDPQPEHGLITPAAPRFGYNEIVYLKESAETIGELEGFRISELEWNSEINQWVYVFDIFPRPGKNMTVGDRDDWKRIHQIKYAEADLVTVCEAMPLKVAFLQRAVDRANWRKNSFCPGTG
jgi:hypothetical protein